MLGRDPWKADVGAPWNPEEPPAHRTPRWRGRLCAEPAADLPGDKGCLIRSREPGRGPEVRPALSPFYAPFPRRAGHSTSFIQTRKPLLRTTSHPRLEPRRGRPCSPARGPAPSLGRQHLDARGRTTRLSRHRACTPASAAGPHGALSSSASRIPSWCFHPGAWRLAARGADSPPDPLTAWNVQDPPSPFHRRGSAAQSHGQLAAPETARRPVPEPRLSVTMPSRSRLGSAGRPCCAWPVAVGRPRRQRAGVPGRHEGQHAAAGRAPFKGEASLYPDPPTPSTCH